MLSSGNTSHKTQPSPQVRKRSGSWTCGWLPFSCACNDDEIETASPISRSLTDDLFWDPPANSSVSGSGSSGTQSMISHSTTSGTTGSIVATSASLNSILEDDSTYLLDGDIPSSSNGIARASRCQGPRCYNCGSAAVQMLGSDLKDAQSHPMIGPLLHESFCNQDCIWTMLLQSNPNQTGVKVSK